MRLTAGCFAKLNMTIGWDTRTRKLRYLANNYVRATLPSTHVRKAH